MKGACIFMLQIKEFSGEEVTVLNSDTGETSVMSVIEAENRGEILGVAEDEFFIPSTSGIKAMSFIDLDDCMPSLIHTNHLTFRYGEEAWHRYSMLNYRVGDNFVGLGDVALKACSGKYKEDDAFFIKDDFLYILADESNDHYLYFKYRVLDKEK